MSKWIWLFGEYEVYHNRLVHRRREQYGAMEPVIWRLPSNEPVVTFFKTVESSGGEVFAKANGSCSVFYNTGTDMFSEVRVFPEEPFILPAGKVRIRIIVENLDSFPCLFVSGAVESDESWEASDMSSQRKQVGCSDWYTSEKSSPLVFPFDYEPVMPVKSVSADQGNIFDFGKELFGRITIRNLKEPSVEVRLGESMEEALDPQWSVIRYKIIGRSGGTHQAAAFRYVYVSDPSAEVSAEYEYLPLERRGSFEAEDPLLNRIWETAAYTFHLNSREFFLDGIKRDRWVWCADAYQSLFVNHYLFFNKDIERRTLIALAGKPPVRQHINTIMDYTFFWFIALEEYFRTYGDRELLLQLQDTMKSLMDFVLGRLSDDGYARGLDGDWVFIDWADMDKEGALLGEQVLLYRALKSYIFLCEQTGLSCESFSERAERLYEQILRDFYDDETGVFVDSYESGRRNITRQNNLLAYLFLPLSTEAKHKIYERVVLNSEVPEITTPYFKFYENQVRCMEMEAGQPMKSICAYYGAMLAAGATTLYEEFDPEKKGTEHYAMYGRPYEKSLCHAWSASPVYLLGAYRLGVKNTGIAYSTYEVRPDLRDQETYRGTVPVPGGSVRVEVDRKSVTVFSDIHGGTLYVNDQSWSIPAGKALKVSR